MEANKLTAYVGRVGLIGTGHGTLKASVVVIDAKTAYGKTRVHVEPLTHGHGGAWVDVDSVTFDGVEARP